MRSAASAARVRSAGEQQRLAFARAWDPLPIHVDPESEAARRHGDIIASGEYTLAVGQHTRAKFRRDLGRSFRTNFGGGIRQEPRHIRLIQIWSDRRLSRLRAIGRHVSWNLPIVVGRSASFRRQIITILTNLSLYWLRLR